MIAVPALWAFGVELRLPKPGTLATLLGTFTIATIGYQAWARQKLTNLTIRVGEQRSQAEQEDRRLCDDLLSCARNISTVFRDRVDLHMVLGSVAYGLFLLVFLTEKSFPDSWSEYLECIQVASVAWFVPNLMLLGCVAVSLNDFLGDVQPLVRNED
ncbi:hypothetical protein [Candidatus Poriferisodalis sp.]|uniref:hypothetical protein n=1 Tax=Candidatus Poriferisodalis sp. TaxID=3101277 RepID=UPI003B522EF2